MLTNIINQDRAIIISPFINFNIMLGLNIANELSHLSSKNIVIATSYKIPSYLIREIIRDGNNILLIDSFKCLDNVYAHIIILNNIDADELLISCLTTTNKIFVLAEKLHRIHKLGNSAWNVYKVRKINPNTYSILDAHEGNIVVLGVKGCSIYKLEMPEDVVLIYREVVNHVKEFGSIKASELLRYMVKTLGYDREFVLNAIRRSVAMGIIRYQSGYLIPQITINS
ncbi:MAG: hypothetical protein QW438_03495 [Ignisphaera sp.]